MINRIEIEKLFNLYDYDLGFTGGDNENLCILTGPNGFGKTTILLLIKALYTRDYELMASIKFDSVVYHFDGKVFEVRQKREMEDVDISSDLPGIEKVSLECTFLDEGSYGSGTPLTMLIDIEDGGADWARNELNSFNLFMNSRQCFYISDSRQVNIKTDTESVFGIYGNVLYRDVEKFKDLLSDVRYNAADESELDTDFADRLNLFREIISNCRLANKTMQIHQYFGIRFQLNNDSGEFIGVDRLSSGEKHIVLQTLELLFFAKDGVVAMIDEPELSFHPAWLNRYISDIEKIQSMKSLPGKSFQIILATHSPTLVGQRWNDCIDLYEHQKYETGRI